MRDGGVSVGEALVGLLEAYGVTDVFGIPGVHNVEMYRALPRSGITHVLTRHEQGAGFMADGYARASGKPGVCFTITGPGLTNIMTPMGQAYSDSVPMLVISSTLDVKNWGQGRGRLHEMRSQLNAAATVSQIAATCYSARDVQDRVAEAFSLFASARPRPVYLEIPLDVLKQPAGRGWKPRALASKPRATPDEIASAVARLSAAARPVIILGGGARRAGTAAAKIAEKTGAVIFTTIAAKGAIADDHPLLAGSLLPNPLATKVIMAADAILAVGTELSETDLWYQTFDITTGLIRVDIDPASLARPYPADLPITGDAEAVLSDIADSLPDQNKADARAGQVRELRIACADGHDDLRQTITTVLDTVRAAVPADTIIASDMTQIAYAANEVLRFSQPDCYLHPAGFGTLGYALPAAVGARVACPDRPVIAMAGDYGVQYTINELGTAAELGKPLVVLLWNNDALGQIRDDMVHKGIQPNAVTLINPDFAALAKAYNCDAIRPQTLDELSSALKTGLAAEGPVLIEVRPAIVKG
ncbi:5-guanidino-2-oxopentanoate decarboxylase [Anderseniella sp. Alg231-50]|uniref:5-guanidino-2-oxopentanoate decarboxylase n=1 Tax=Anderseniella sp. Alg231-50 TaxID=1922226 RepID=UPI00307B9BF6